MCESGWVSEEGVGGVNRLSPTLDEGCPQSPHKSLMRSAEQPSHIDELKTLLTFFSKDSVGLAFQ